MAKETFTCKKCNTLNPLAKNVFQSVSCFNCNTKHAIVTIEGKKAFYAYHDQVKRTAQGGGNGSGGMSVRME